MTVTETILSMAHLVKDMKADISAESEVEKDLLNDQDSDACLGRRKEREGAIVAQRATAVGVSGGVVGQWNEWRVRCKARTIQRIRSSEKLVQEPTFGPFKTNTPQCIESRMVGHYCYTLLTRSALVDHLPIILVKVTT